MALVGATKLVKAVIDVCADIICLMKFLLVFFTCLKIFDGSVNLYIFMVVLADKPHPNFQWKFWVKKCSLSTSVYLN